MSYILDALKRADADRERDRGAIPDLHTRQSQPSPATAFFARETLPLWAWAVGACLIAGAAGAWWLWARPQLAQPAAATVTSDLPPSGTAARASPPAVAPAAQLPSPPPLLSLPVLRPEQATATVSAAATPAPPAYLLPLAPPAQLAVADAARREAGENARTLKAEKQALADQAAQLRLQEAADKRKAQKDARQQAAAQKSARLASTAAATTIPITAATTAPAGTAATTNEDQRIYSLADLPPEVRQQLPALALSGATYSENPLYRMLIINGQVFQEKSTPAPGVTLERIQPKQAVLVFRGYRYFVKY